MTVVEKAAYLKGLVEGLGVEPESKEGKLWAALNDLLSDVAHELEDLQANAMDHAQALDDVCEELSYLEELTCDLDCPEDFDEAGCGRCRGCMEQDDEDDDDEDEDDDDDEELEYDGVIYDVTCPVCGNEMSLDEETLEKGFIECPGCGEKLEFDLSEEENE